MTNLTSTGYFRYVRHIPNAITLLNLLSGFAAIVLLFNDSIFWALVFAGLALIADVLDGVVARMLNVTSELGTQLDSVADMVSFGVLPGCIVAYLWTNSCGFPIQWPTALLAGLIPTATGLRLARFNLDTRDRKSFYGLPSPSAAVFVFGLLLMVHFEPGQHEDLLCDPAMFIGISIVLPFLLLSNLRLWSLKGLSGQRGGFIFGGLLIALAICVFFLGPAGISTMVAVYVLFGILNYLVRLY